MNLWDSVYSSDNSFFGEEPSILAKESIGFLEQYNCKNILEFGCGQGRDSIFFARNGFKVLCVDSSKISTSQLSANAYKLGLEEAIEILQADLPANLASIKRENLFDAAYSHLFYCMPFNDKELRRLFDFVYDILPEKGLHIFSIRNKDKDQSFGKGTEIARDTFEIDGFSVRFFTAEEILSYNHRFKTLQVVESYEHPCSLTLVFSVRY